MKVQVQQGSFDSIKADSVIVFCLQDKNSLSDTTTKISRKLPAIKALLTTSDFKGSKGSQALLYSGDKLKSTRLLLVGLGSKKDLTIEGIRRASSSALKKCSSLGCSTVAIVFPEDLDFQSEPLAQAIVEGAILGQYKFDKYITIKKVKKKVSSISICVKSADKTLAKHISAGAKVAQHICEGVYLTRDLANAPNNEVYPEELARRAQSAGEEVGIAVTVFNKKKIEALKMGGLLAVNQGSVRPPVFIVMEYKGGASDSPPIVLIGKGITFDSGGISLKQPGGMSDMKMDMHGSATVIGAIYSAAKLKLPVNIVTLVPSTENLPSGSAFVPGDIITFANGKTAEIDNTDAEGRLILADALHYAINYNPQAVIDFATLTGACVVALGGVTSGMMGTDDDLKRKIKKAADTTNEYVCELPLYDEYEDQIKSDVADIKNSGGRPAAAITAALFLKHFIGNYPWVHLDIAGTGVSSKEGPYSPKGGTGVGVRLIIEMLRNWN